MTSVYIVVIIVILLVILVSYAFITQTVDQKRRQKQRYLAALKQRVRNFNYMLSGFPDNFLPKDIILLIYRCLIDIYEQLEQLEPEVSSHTSTLADIKGQMQAAENKTMAAKAKPLQDPQQIKEVRQHLQGLYSFILHMVKRKNISQSQGELYRGEIKRLVTQISVDALMLSAKKAQSASKNRLALHHYQQAFKLLSQENSGGVFQKQLAKLQAVIQQLEQKISEEELASPEAAEEEEGKGWDKYSKDESWKKKNVYD